MTSFVFTSNRTIILNIKLILSLRLVLQFLIITDFLNQTCLHTVKIDSFPINLFFCEKLSDYCLKDIETWNKLSEVFSAKVYEK
jgi:hypothetical protein